MRVILRILTWFLRPKDKKLGVAPDGGQRYDLPLNKGSGTGFLIMLVALMTFLAAMALTMSFVMGEITHRWAAGLENRMTIEIPAEDSEGKILDKAALREKAAKVTALLDKQKEFIASYNMMSEEEIAALLTPWLGENLVLQDIPLPALIAVDIKPKIKDLDAQITALQENLAAIAPDIRIDTHEDWLGELVRFTASLRFGALMVTLLIGVTMVAAVAGGINSRIAIHRKEVELLHLMGARDNYINRQFQRHALILCLQGSLIGLCGAFVIMGLIALVSGGGNTLLPDMSLSTSQIGILLALPAFSALVGAVTARYTVLRALSKMP